MKETGGRSRIGGMALVLSGGGARAAYQVGVLQAIAERRPDLRIPILTGVSAGAINAAHLAAHTGSFREAVEDLRAQWGHLDSAKVYGATPVRLARSAASWLVRAILGGRSRLPDSRGFFNVRPLRDFLAESVDFAGIDANLSAGRLRAVALSATCYATGQSTTFVHGAAGVPVWRRAMRIAVRARLTLEHVMASCAIPIVFPAVRIGDWYFGDGSVRQTSPLAPAIHLGAQRILAIASGPRVFRARPAEASDTHPTLADVLALLLDSVFLDALDADVERLDRVNRLLEALPRGQPASDLLRRVDLLVLRPSVDLSESARGLLPLVSSRMSLLVRTMGVSRARGLPFLSYLLFEPAHTDRLIEIGRSDVLARWEQIDRFLGPKLEA